MLIKRPRGWELPERLATPESIYLNRRALLKQATGLAFGAIALSACDNPASTSAVAAAETVSDPTGDLYPAARNGAFTLDRDLTAEEEAATYNNFYEFGSHKRIFEAAQALPIRPWTVAIDGDVEEPKRVDIDTLIRAMKLEERLYRHRCVERWAMAVPWTGFPLKALVEWARPLSGVRYVRFETFQIPEVATGQRQSWYPWPYTEGLTIAEATSELPFLVTGVYGKPIANQFGAPLRLALPWKYGFKSIKSIMRISFTSERPIGFWEEIQASEYGFWANVNPEVPHPRWSQAEERMLGTGETRATQIFNGYGEHVAHLYAGLEGQMLYR